MKKDIIFMMATMVFGLYQASIHNLILLYCHKIFTQSGRVFLCVHIFIS